MGNPSGRYAIVGVGTSRFGKLQGVSAMGFTLEASANAMADAGIARDAVDGVLVMMPAVMGEQHGWAARVADLGGGFGIRHHPDEDAPDAVELAATAAATARKAFVAAGLPEPAVWLEPGRCLVGRAGVTLYRVGAVKRLPDRTWVAIDGGMSDNPRPQLYDARYTAWSAARADESPDEAVSVAGMHCESGDVLIDDVFLPSPRRGDLLAVPATGAYTLAMSSNYNGVGRPAAALVGGGEARLIRRRETTDDLLRLET